MNKEISNIGEFMTIMRGIHKQRDKPFGRKFVYVDAELRRKFLTSDKQGKMVLSATATDIIFESVGGGVYKAYPESLKTNIS